MPSIAQFKLLLSSHHFFYVVDSEIKRSFCIALEQYRHENISPTKPFESAGKQLSVAFIKQYVMSLQSPGN